MFHTVVHLHKLGEVEKSAPYIILSAWQSVPKIIEVGGNFKKLRRKQVGLFFIGTWCKLQLALLIE